MPGNAKECRERALECMELVRNARTPEHKRLLIDIAQSWLNVATEIERAKDLMSEYGTPATAAEPTHH